MDAILVESRLAFAGKNTDSSNVSPNVSYDVDNCLLLTSVFDVLLHYATAVMELVIQSTDTPKFATGTPIFATDTPWFD